MLKHYLILKTTFNKLPLVLSSSCVYPQVRFTATLISRNIRRMSYVNVSHRNTLRNGNNTWIPKSYFSGLASLYEEEEIPVPWGTIGARRWGDPSKKPVLVVHGWKDNLASFDRLLPLLLPELKDKYYFVAIDLPGHGFSSHFPPGMMYEVPDCLRLFARIIRHYQWTQPINFLGHSFGGILGFMFATLNPGTIDGLISLDALTPVLFKLDEILAFVPKGIQDALSFEEKLSHGKAPVYSYEEIFQRLMSRNVGRLDGISAKILLSRGICESKPGSGLFHFTHDIRVEYLPLTMISTGQVKSLAKNLRCSILQIQATDGVHYERPYVRRNVEGWIRSCEDAPADREVRFIEVKGQHHVHLMNPSIIAPHIIKFLQR